eukprot:NODE_33952_length_272_cov_4.551724.p1 GENE.NODE_33952_length_272_cov_4.551724~~NODE_33952_length_272_cov_4.551724.p1  ORF type:complete len:52 (-),score=23.35 NODE_33952_length_272_cov_4.551724:22-177(-)
MSAHLLHKKKKKKKKKKKIWVDTKNNKKIKTEHKKTQYKPYNNYSYNKHKK